MDRTRATLLSLTLAAVLLCPALEADAAVGPVLVSLHSDDVTKGDEASGVSAGYLEEIATSKDGSVIAFQSDATNLVAGDTNGYTDVFVRDTALGTTERVSVATRGDQGDEISVLPSISADGRLVAFQSYAENLVPDDGNGKPDVFVHDRTTHTTRLVSHKKGSTGAADNCSYAPSISPEGDYVSFDSFASDLADADTNPGSDVFIRNLVTDGIDIASLDEAGKPIAGHALTSSISSDGLRIAFLSKTALTSDDTNGEYDVFVRDRLADTTVLATPGAKPSNDVDPIQLSFQPELSDDGKFVAFTSSAQLDAADKNTAHDVYRRNLGAKLTVLVSVADDETHGEDGSAEPSISGDGTLVGFDSANPQYTGSPLGWPLQAYVRNVGAGTTTMVSRPPNTTPNRGGGEPAVSPDGKRVAFWSSSSNLSPLDSDVIVDVYVSDAQPRR